MSKQQPNISQIQKYLRGELDAEAMHRLERRAQDDPFLMDALEGYESARTNQQSNLDMLSRQLNMRTDKKVKLMLPWSTIAIAASVLGFLVVAGVLYNGNKPIDQQQTAVVTVKRPDAVQQPEEAPLIRNKELTASEVPQVAARASAPSLAYRKFSKARIASNSALQPGITDASGIIAADSVPLEDRVMNYIAAQPDTATMHQVVATKKPSYSNALTAEAKGVTKSLPSTKSTNDDYYLSQLNLPGQLAGVVNKKKSGAPLPGVVVKIDGQDIATQTNANGAFASSGIKARENVGYGYLDKKIKANGDSTHVELSTRSSSLAEVVVADADKANLTKAHPINGWSEFGAYIKKNAVLPVNQKTGIVKVNFIVAADGSVRNLVTSQSLSPEADKLAIDLIKRGPRWTGNATGKDETVSLTIEFRN